MSAGGFQRGATDIDTNFFQIISTSTLHLHGVFHRALLDGVMAVLGFNILFVQFADGFKEMPMIIFLDEVHLVDGFHDDVMAAWGFPQWLPHCSP